MYLIITAKIPPTQDSDYEIGWERYAPILWKCYHILPYTNSRYVVEPDDGMGGTWRKHQDRVQLFVNDNLFNKINKGER